MYHYPSSPLVVHRFVFCVLALALFPTVSAEEKICTTRFGVTKCRSKKGFYIKLAIIGSILFLAFLGLLVYLLIRHRRRRELDALVSDMEPSQIQGAQPRTYRSPPPPAINVMAQVPSPQLVQPPYSASPYGHHDGGAAYVSGHGTLAAEHMMFAGPTGTPHYPNSAYGDAQHQQPQSTPVVRRRSTDDERKISPRSSYPFAGYSSENPPSPLHVVAPSTPSNPGRL